MNERSMSYLLAANCAIYATLLLRLGVKKPIVYPMVVVHLA